MEYTTTIRIKCPMCGHVNDIGKSLQEYYDVRDDKPFVMTSILKMAGAIGSSRP